MRYINVTAWLIALSVMLMPCAANAVGLGRLSMLSALGDPLHVEIDLVSVSKEEFGSLSARLSGPDAYRQANLQYNAALVGARVSIERRPGGQPFVRIRSTRPVSEPFIDVLVEITSSSGRLVREYTVLVDPPGAAPPPAAVAAPAVRPAPAPEAPVTAPPTAVRRPAAPAAAPAAGAKEYGPVQRGENLTKIAQSVKPEGVTLEQMLVGLYRSNPDAFINKNLNLVKSGRILRVPEKDEVAALAPAEARKEFRAQVADWNAYRQNVASGAAPARTEGRTTTGGRISTKVEDKAGGDPKDVVRLSRGEPPGAAKGKPRSTAERVRALEEEVVSRDKALNEANERIAQLEKTIKDMQKLVELKSPGMAAAQQKAEQAAKAKAEAKPEPKPEAKADAKADAKKAEAPKAEAKADAKKAEAPKAEAKAEPKPEPKPDAKPEAKPDAVAAAKPDAAKPEPAKPAAPTPDAAKADAAKSAPDAKADAKAEAPKADQAKAPEEPKAKPKPKVVAPPPPPPPPDLMDQVMEAATDPLYLSAGAGALALGGLAFWMARRRRRDTDDEPRKAPPVLGRQPEPEADAGGAAMPVATATAAAAAAAPSDDVDPLAEAEVYIAYGRDAQAEEILKEALAKNPQRQDAQLKLLEIYAARKDKTAFNKLAADFNRQTGGTGANWMAAAAMGYALDPGNALYEAGKHAPAAPITGGGAPASDLDFELGGDTTGLATDITLDSGTVPASHDTTAILDASSMPGHDSTAIMDAGELQRMAAEAEKEPEPLMPDFSLDIPDTSAPPRITQTDISLDAAPPTQDGHMIDFQIELPKAADAVDQTQVNATGAPVTDAGGLDFKLDIPDLDLGDKSAGAGAGGEKDGHWYDVQTKFDLAKAYQEMGDKDGAKEILQEVIKEGDAEQQAEAKKLLDSLA